MHPGILTKFYRDFAANKYVLKDEIFQIRNANEKTR